MWANAGRGCDTSANAGGGAFLGQRQHWLPLLQLAQHGRAAKLRLHVLRHGLQLVKGVESWIAAVNDNAANKEEMRRSVREVHTGKK